MDRIPVTLHLEPPDPSNGPALENLPLQVTIQEGVLLIAVGVETLAYCSTQENGGPLEEGCTVSDSPGWANSVRQSLESEDEVGNSLLTEMLEEAMGDAADAGSPHLTYPPRNRRRRS